jgi:hypothetical protein
VNFKDLRRNLGLPILLLWWAAIACQFSQAETLLSTDFEGDPATQGWTTSGAGVASWSTNEAFSGGHSISATNKSWLSPLIETTPLQWVRLSFKSKAPGPLSKAGTIGYGYWAAEFYDTNGVKLNDDQYSSVFQSAGWVTNEFRIRAKHTAGTNGTLLPARMQIRFQAFASELFVDDVLVETVDSQEVARWGDTYYDRIPAKLAYVPKSTHWSRLPETMNRLRTGQNLRIVMLGDSVQQDTVNAPIDAWLERLYPGATIELLSSTRGGTGVKYFQDHMAEFVFAYRPNLLCIGGISQDDRMSDFQNVVDQVRADDMTNGRSTEILILTKQWSPNSNRGYYILAPSMSELDQVPENNPGGVPDDYRGHLLTLCASNNIEYLDLTGVAAEFIYGPAANAGVGPPSDTNGYPYSFWMRDDIHSSDNGKMIQGRMLEAYFAPAPRLQIERLGDATRFTWPLASAGFQLQSTSLIGPGADWTTNSAATTITNGQNGVNTAFSDGTDQRYFRLHRP